MARRQLLVLYDACLGLCFCDCEAAQRLCVFSFAVSGLCVARTEILRNGFCIIVCSHHAGMCVVAS